MKKRRLKKLQPINFTPLVDLNMLLIVFFLFCNAMSKPNTIDITLPISDKYIPDDFWNNRRSFGDSFPVTFILDANNKIYRYTGLPQYDDYTYLKEMTYADLRPYLLERFKQNQSTRAEKTKLKRYKDKGFITDREYKDGIDKIEYDHWRYGDPVLIKPTEKATYKNLIDILDEMDICQIPKFHILDMSEGDYYVLENYITKGELSNRVWYPK